MMETIRHWETVMHRRDLLKSAALFATSVAAVAGNAAGAPTRGEAGSPASATNVNAVIVRYLAAWNERSAEQRHDLIVKTWAEDGLYVDAHRRGSGHDGIDAMITAAQQQYPGYRLRLVSSIETHNGFVRFRWAAGGSAEAPLYLAGTDFAMIAGDGRLKSVTGFIDAAPARLAQN